MHEDNASVEGLASGVAHHLGGLWPIKLIEWNCRSVDSVKLSAIISCLDSNTLCACLVETWSNSVSLFSGRYSCYSTDPTTSGGNGVTLLALRAFPTIIVFKCGQTAICIAISTSLGVILVIGVYLNPNSNKGFPKDELLNYINRAITNHKPVIIVLLGDFNRKQADYISLLRSIHPQIYTEFPVSRHQFKQGSLKLGKLDGIIANFPVKIIKNQSAQLSNHSIFTFELNCNISKETKEVYSKKKLLSIIDKKHPPLQWPDKPISKLMKCPKSIIWERFKYDQLDLTKSKEDIQSEIYLRR